MNIAIEAQRLFRSRKHGMDVVAHELLKRLPVENDTNTYHILVKEDDDNCLVEKENRVVHILKKMFYPIWEQFLLPKYCSKIKVDILHCTANTAPIILNIPLILTLHDVIFLEQSNINSKASWYQKLGNTYRSFIVPIVAKKAVKILTVSAYQKKIIAQKLHISPDKISVIHNGVDERFFQSHTSEEIEKVLKKYKLQNGYIFFMANTEPRKNTSGVLKAYQSLLKENSNAPRLVMKGISLKQLKEYLIREKLESLLPKIDVIGYVNYEDLPMLYQGACMLWFPSFSEGFGLPIIEAMACGVPVITSNISCMPEIAGNAAMLINPSEPKEIANACQELLENNTLYQTLSSSGKKRALLFTWDISVKKLINIYKEVENNL